MWKTTELLIKTNNAFEHTLRVSAGCAGVLVIFLMLGINIEVVRRYFFNSPIPWMSEVMGYSILWITFLGTAWVLKREAHVKMELLLSQLSPKARAIVIIITSVIAATACAFIVWSSAETFLYYYQTGFVCPTERRFLKYPIFVIIPIGSFFLFIQFLRRIYAHLESWRGFQAEKKEAEERDRIKLVQVIR